MPVYEYDCPRCLTPFEGLYLAFSPRTDWAACPRCLGPAPKVPSASTPVFKGDGWTRPPGWTPGTD